MGIYDREYYRQDGPRFLDYFSRTGQVCKWLLFINVGVFLLQLLTMPRGAEGFARVSSLTDWFILDPGRVLDGQVWRLLTYAFLHSPGDIFHIIFNMAFLWWLGSDVEDLYGSWEFLTFYLLAALVGGLAFQTWAMAQAEGIFYQCLGASGAVTAVMVLFACHYPTRMVYVMFLIRVPIWAFVAFCIVMDSVAFVGGNNTTTAVVVHLAGAAFGFGYYKLQWRLSPWWKGLLDRKARSSRPRLRVYHGEPEASRPVAAAEPAPGVDEQLEAKLDAVLEKVARSGQESLSESERQILFRASEIYKKRRS